MRGNIIAYHEMCRQEKTSLQRGMNFQLAGNYSVILMSIRKNSPYQDQIKDRGTVLIYEGHDEARSSKVPYPKLVDQPRVRPSGVLTQNGKFHKAAQEYKSSGRNPEVVRVYEKILKGVWSDNGFFHLVDSWIEDAGERKVFKFKLLAIENFDNNTINVNKMNKKLDRTRVIPSSVKREVWQRDGGKCVECGATDELHFDHVLPFSKGGTSMKVENIQILCARHNLMKSNKIE